MLTDYSEIKAQLLDEWEYTKEERLHEVAESLTPVYYSDIVKEWQELPSEATDAWKEFGPEFTPETTIYALMTTDLHLYYQSEVERAYIEIKNEKEQEKEEDEETYLAS
jgi:hypothetical protein